MKRLILVRHAKSSWKHKNVQDIDRPLNKRGERDAPEMGKRLAGRSVVVDLILTSPAVRAQRTAELIALELQCVEAVQPAEELYNASAWEILDVIRHVEDSKENVMIFGHNPGMTDLANDLSAMAIEKLPTCGIVELNYDIFSWKEIATKKPEAFGLDYPKRKQKT